MSKKMSYKAIVRNMVDLEIRHYIEKRTDKYPWFDDDGVVFADYGCDGEPMFKANVQVDYRWFEIHGFVHKYGNVVVTSVSFDRMRCTEKDENGEWIMESAKRYSEFIYGDALKEFKFDR